MSSEKTNRIAQLFLVTASVIIIALDYPASVSSQDCVHPKYMFQQIRAAPADRCV